jgi:hypothetical protein
MPKPRRRERRVNNFNNRRKSAEGGCVSKLLKYVGVSVFAVLLALSGCGGQNKNVPAWMSDLPADNADVVHGFGCSKSGDDKVSSQRAEEMASLMAAFKYSKAVSSASGSDIEGSVKVEAMSLTLGWNTSRITVIKQEKMSDGAYWCLVAYNVSANAANIDKMNKAFESLDRNIELYEKKMGGGKSKQ